jgi:flagellar biogenesis protein FliO
MPGTGGAASYGDLLITSLVVLAGVCIAAFVVVKVVGRFLATGRMRGAHLLDVIARLPLEPRRSLYVVEVAGKTLLVGTSEMGLSVLSELDGDEVKARAVPKQSFGELVRSAWSGRRRIGDVSAETRSANVSDVVSRDVSAETRSAAVSDAASRDVSAETRSAAVSDAASRDVSAETRSARADVSDIARSVANDVAAETPGAHVGASDATKSATSDVSAETRSVGASAVKSRDASAETRGASDVSRDDSAGTRREDS